jgi:hypothetical protein
MSKHCFRTIEAFLRASGVANSRERRERRRAAEGFRPPSENQVRDHAVQDERRHRPAALHEETLSMADPDPPEPPPPAQ